MRLLTIICIMSLPYHVNAKDKTLILSEVIDFCFQLPDEQNIVIGELLKQGWVQIEDDDETILSILFSSVFTQRHRSSDIEYTYQNSFFIAASILSNSSLLPNQPAFSKEELKLGVLGVREGKPYCVIAGPKWVSIAIQGKLGVKLKKPLPYLRSYSGNIDGYKVNIKEIDKEQFYSHEHNIPKEKIHDYRKLDKTHLYETNIFIASIKLLEE